MNLKNVLSDLTGTLLNKRFLLRTCDQREVEMKSVMQLKLEPYRGDAVRK